MDRARARPFPVHLDENKTKRFFEFLSNQIWGLTAASALKKNKVDSHEHFDFWSPLLQQPNHNGLI